MSKKVLVISGSPRKGGNSDILCDQFIKGCTEAGNVVEKIYLRDKKYNFCLACYGCTKSGVCVQKDDMAEIIEKMSAADVIVLASPVYFYAIDGQMKTMIDRTLPCYYTHALADKDFYFIGTAAECKDAVERALDAMYGLTDCVENAHVRGVIYGGGVIEKGDVKNTAAIAEAYELGKKA